MNNTPASTIETLVKHFTNTILTRSVFLIVLTIVGLTYNILPNWSFAALVFILAFHIIELKIVNLSFQAYFENDAKFVMMLKVLDYVTLSMSILYIFMIALISVL